MGLRLHFPKLNSRPAFGRPRPKVTMVARENMMQKVWHTFPYQICPKWHWAYCMGYFAESVVHVSLSDLSQMKLSILHGLFCRKLGTLLPIRFVPNDIEHTTWVTLQKVWYTFPYQICPKWYWAYHMGYFAESLVHYPIRFVPNDIKHTVCFFFFAESLIQFPIRLVQNDIERTVWSFLERLV